MGVAVLFPGQGSQFVGMGADLFSARPDLLGPDADAVLGWSLEQMCLDGPEDVLTRTEHAQPALFALSVALWRSLEDAGGPSPMAAAGHSLGEFSALVASGMVDYLAGLEAVAARGQAMADAAALEPSGMAALLGADLEKAEEVAGGRRAEGGRLYVANDNAPGQVVVAGGEADLSWLEEHARSLGVRRVIRLKVAGAFHSPFMEPAAVRVGEAVRSLDVDAGAFPVYANVDARPVAPDEVARSLERQVVGRVRFAETIRNLDADGAFAYLHVGPGDVTAGMVKRTLTAPSTHVLRDLAGIESLRSSLASVVPGGGS